MTLLAPWFLAGLAVLVPLVALHLRRRRRRQEVSSLLLWRELSAGGPGRRRISLTLSLLLALQALILALIVVGLTRPESDGGGSQEARAAQVFVVDPALVAAGEGGGVAAGGASGGAARQTAARADLDRRLAQVPAGTSVSIVLAAATPQLVADGVSPRDADDAVAALRAGAAGIDLRAGVALAGGELHGGGAVTLLHATGDEPPRVRTEGVRFDAVAVGEPAARQILEPPVARCDPGDGDAPSRCTVFAAARNDSASAVEVRLVVEDGGREIASRALSIDPGGRDDVAFAAAPDARLTLRLLGDGNAEEDRATVVVPDAARPVDVTLVSSRGAASALARGLSSAPGVRLRVVAPSAFDAADARGSALVVLDRWVPDGALPVAPALLLVDPPRLPDGQVGGALPDPELSGEDAGAPLLAGVDLDGLAIAAGGARRVVLPPPLRALAWAPGGPLIAAGDSAGPEGDGRVALLTFDPEASTLPQQPAFPVLLANVVAWSQDRLTPDGTAVGTSASVGAVAAGSSAAVVVLRAGDGGGVAPSPRRAWWPWLLAAALLVLLVEWSYPRWSRRAAAGA